MCHHLGTVEQFAASGLHQRTHYMLAQNHARIRPANSLLELTSCRNNNPKRHNCSFPSESVICYGERSERSIDVLKSRPYIRESVERIRLE